MSALFSDPPIGFTASPLDRASNLRREEGWLTARRAAPESRFLPLTDLKAQIRLGGQRPDIGWISAAEAAPLLPGHDAVFLGLENDVAHFAFDAGQAAPATGCKFIDVRTIAPQLPDGHAAILAQARSLVDWHARHGFCAVCGHKTELREAGYARYCSNGACKAQHFPRTDPVVIMLVEREGRLLLGRQERFPAGMFSALAGFMEPGETIEEAVRREVLEEASIVVGSVRYMASQPWPFPSSLMIGCVGEALSEAVKIDPKELESARWFERHEVEAMLRDSEDMAAPLRIGAPIALAHQLAKRWLAGA